MIARLLAGARRDSGDCPEPQELIAYASARLDRIDAEALRAHVLVCGTCELFVHNLRSLPASDWEECAPRIARAVHDMAVKQRARPRAWIAVPGYGLAAALAIAFVVYRLPHPAPVAPTATPQPASPRLVQIPVVELLPLQRGQGRAVTVIPAEANQILLSFSLPMQPSRHYTARVSSAAGDTVLLLPELRGSRPEGRFYLLCQMGSLKPGPYQLVVSSGGLQDPEFIFPFDYNLPATTKGAQ